MRLANLGAKIVRSMIRFSGRRLGYSVFDGDLVAICGTQTFIDDCLRVIPYLREFEPEDEVVLRFFRSDYLIVPALDRGNVNHRHRTICVPKSYADWGAEGILYYLAYVGFWSEEREGGISGESLQKRAREKAKAWLSRRELSPSFSSVVLGKPFLNLPRESDVAGLQLWPRGGSSVCADWLSRESGQ